MNMISRTTIINGISLIVISVIINIINSYVDFHWIRPIIFGAEAAPVVPPYSEFCITDGSFDNELQYLKDHGKFEISRYTQYGDSWDMRFSVSEDSVMQFSYKVNNEPNLCKGIHEVYTTVMKYNG